MVSWAETVESLADALGDRTYAFLDNVLDEFYSNETTIKYLERPGEVLPRVPYMSWWRPRKSSPLPWVALGASVLLLAVCACLVGRRPPRAWLAWAWLPGAGALAMVGLAVGRDTPRDDDFFVREVALLGPSGVGSIGTTATIQSWAGSDFRLKTSWPHGSRMFVAELPERFRTPFRPHAGDLRLLEDRAAGTMEISMQAVPRVIPAELRWWRPIQLPTARLERRGQSLWIVNGSRRAVNAAVICTGFQRAVVRALLVGEAREVNLTSAAVAKDAAGERLVALLSYPCQRIPSNSYLLTTLGEPADAPEITPTMARKGMSLHLVSGPMPLDEGSR